MKVRNVIILLVVFIALSIFGTLIYTTHKNPVKQKAGTCSVVLPNVSTKGSLKKAEALVNKITKGRVAIVKHFKSVGNLIGLVVKPKVAGGQKGIMYVDNAGNYLLTGLLLNSAGQNVAQNDYQKYIQAAQAIKAMKNAAATNWFQQGSNKAPHKVYVLADPNCIFCHKQFEVLQPKIKSGQLAVRWIMVGFLKPSSLGKAYAILGAKDPVAAMVKNEFKFNESTEEGSIKVDVKPTAELKAKIAANMKFMMDSGFNATPVVLYVSKSGKPAVVNGFVQGAGLDKMITNMSNKF